MEIALNFNDVQFDVIDRNGQAWVRLSQIATALQYASAQRVIELYTRHADEFTDSMTALVKLPTQGGEQENRIFSLRGCHLLAMLARTPVAKDFRKWVLDVLDRMAEQEAAAYPALPPAACADLKSTVDAKLSAFPDSIQGKARSEIWSRFNRHFRIASYSQLAPEKLQEGKDYIIQLEVKAIEKFLAQPVLPESAAQEQQALPTQEQQGLPFNDGVPDCPVENLPHSLPTLFDKADEIKRLLVQMQTIMNFTTSICPSPYLTGDKVVLLQNAQDLVKNAWSNLHSLENSIRAFIRIRAQVKFWVSLTKKQTA